MQFNTFLQLLIGGISIGVLYALPALGITLIWNAAGIFNFANGDYVMIAAYLTYALMVTGRLPFYITLPLVIIIMFFFGICMEWLVVENLRRKKKLHNTMVSFIALSITLRYAARFIWGTKPLTYKNPFGVSPVQVGSLFIMPHVFWIIGICLVLMLLLTFLYKKTRLGIAMRATTQNRTSAALMGVKTRKITNLVFGLSASIAGVAGALSGCLFYASMEMGLSFGTKAFAGLIVGGFGNPVGAVIGGLIVGVVETFGAALVSSSMKDIITYVLLLCFLLFRPKGLFKQEIVEKV
ncbi:branched-chain amino acid ABC transporter permease [Anaerolentibacter hominis]|uniref:branched-chain amino acid ABC transporter permease n=1 Tax=Anaerolentibacter hominis TaxID=3079009 RepID=UPI0031B88D29